MVLLKTTSLIRSIPHLPKQRPGVAHVVDMPQRVRTDRVAGELLQIAWQRARHRGRTRQVLVLLLAQSPHHVVDVQHAPNMIATVGPTAVDRVSRNTRNPLSRIDEVRGPLLEV